MKPEQKCRSPEAGVFLFWVKNKETKEARTEWARGEKSKKSLERSRGKVTLVTQGFRFHSKRGGKPVKESEKTYFNSVTLGFILSIKEGKRRSTEIRWIYAKIQTSDGDKLGQDGSSGSGSSGNFTATQVNIPFICSHTITIQRRKWVFVTHHHAQLQENLNRSLYWLNQL